mmetsp:Transcript_2810/g.4047  ORF Transcript_2810/g.4047 Transcript_2810/m.4047 type:complete len:358 (+) Transcript_2810:76-1149(+)
MKWDVPKKNKATAKHFGLMKAKLAKLKRQLLTGSSQGKGSGGGEGFDVSKSGDARIGFVGFPSVGKSTLLNVLTDTISEVGDFEFTTLTAIPGVLQYKGSKLQLLDLPGIIEGAKDGKGRGRQVISTARTCDLIMIVLDALRPLTHKKIIERELEGFGLRLNKEKPKIKFKKKDRGGINMISNVPLTHLDKDIVSSICNEYKCPSADIIFREDATVDQLIDVIEGNRIYTPCIYVLNKIDQITIEELDIIDRMPNIVPISAHHKWNLDELVETIWSRLNLFRVYTKPKGELVDFTDPVILKRNKNSIENFCNRIHKGILSQFKYAYVWGSSVKHNPQKVGVSHELHDEDIVQIVKKV